MAYPLNKTLHRVFEIQAARSPNAIALTFNGKSLTYKELNQQANHLARTLKKRLVLSEAHSSLSAIPVILISVERGFHTIISMFAVLKAGACYVPVDPSDPSERIELIFNDSGARAIICERRLYKRFKSYLPETSDPLVVEDCQKASLYKENRNFRRLNNETSVHDPAYIIDGVMVRHFDIVNSMCTHIDNWGLTQKDRVLGFSSFNFEAAAWEAYSALLSGAILCLTTKEDILPGQLLVDTLRDNKITIAMVIPPSILSVTPYIDLPDLRMIIVGGETYPEALVETWSKEIEFHHVFIQVDQLPLATNGKKLTFDDDIRVNPRTQEEKKLVKLWQKILCVDCVGVLDNFFELGGHTLLAVQLALQIQETFQITCSVKDIFAYPVIAQLALYIQKQSNESGVGHSSINKIERTALLPVSFSQKSLLLLDQCTCTAIRLLGDLRVAQLKKCVDFLIARHESLRTIFKNKSGENYAEIISQASCSIEVKSINRAHLDDAMTEASRQSFDLSSGPLMRLQIFKLGNKNQVLIITQHRIIADTKSRDIFLRELSALYASDESQWPALFPPLAIQYIDYVAWQNQSLLAGDLQQQCDYWRNQLANPTVLNLPTTYPRPEFKTYNGRRHYFYLGRDLFIAIKELERTMHVSLSTLLLSAFAILLGRYSGQEDILISTPIANRLHKDTAGVMGLFANRLALRIDLSKAPNFIMVLERVKQTYLEAYLHQDVPFEYLSEMLGIKCEVMFALQSARDEMMLTLPGIEDEVLTSRCHSVLYDLSLNISEMAYGLGCGLEYKIDLFSAEAMAGLARDFEVLLKALVSNVNQPTPSLA